MQLRNIYDKETLRKQRSREGFERITFSFYRYVWLENLEVFRDELYSKWTELNVLGRIYIAHEGINAQISVPKEKFNAFRTHLDNYSSFNNVPFKIAVQDNEFSFLKLIIRIRKKIVADGLDDNAYDVTNVGKHLSAKEFNEALKDEKTIVVDMRNHYESEVGKFEGAITPYADTFRDALPMVVDALKENKENKILLYCTGGIRCEKASAYMKHHGFNDVNQLAGGIIDYAKQVKDENLESKFIGKNFVFDDRLGERITQDIISVCHQCGSKSDQHVNCANDDCHLLFIQCPACAQKMKGCCTERCIEVISLPVDEQRVKRRGRKKEHAHAVFKSRLRPDLKTELKQS